MHRGEAMNISLLIFNDIAQKEMFLNNLVFHHFIMLTIISVYASCIKCLTDFR